MAKTRINQCLGLSAPFVDTFPVPIVADRAPASTDVSVPLGQVWIDKSGSEPFDIYQYAGGGNWTLGGVEEATTSTFGITQLATLAELQTGTAPAGAYVPTANDVATVIAGVVVGAVPPASEVQQGIAEIATQVETDAGVDDTRIVTPLKLANFVASGGFPGVFTDLTATGAVSFTGVTGGLTMTSTTASSLGVTGAGIDLTLSSAAGRVVVNGEEAAADAVRVLSAAGGLDVDVALQMNLVSSQNAADAIVVNASAGGIDITAAGAAAEDIDIVCTAGSINLTAGEAIATSMVFTNNGMDIVTTGAAGRDIDITNTGGSINIIATENNAGAIIVQANGGAGERVTLLSSQGTGVDSINLESTAGGITLSAALASADAINLAASAGGVDIDGALQVNIASSQNAGDAIRIIASAGGIDIDAVGAAGEDISIVNTGGSLTLQATESDVNAIVINASGAAGGVNMDAGTSGVIVDTTGAISLDSAAASNFTVTGAFDLSLISSLGSVNITAGEDAADAIVLSAGAGGIDILATGAAAQDIDIINTGGSVNITATEDVAEAIYIRANGGTSETIRLHADQGTGVASINIGSDVGGVTVTSGLGSADAINLTASNAAGGIDVDAGTAGVIVDTTGAISLDSAAASNFTVTGAFDLTLNTTAGSLNLTAGEAAADSMVLTNNGMDIVISGAAGRDFDLTNTGGSVNITATENVSDAIVVNASGAASGISVDCGTSGITLGTGLNVSVTSVAAAASPYTVLGTDYFITTDTTGGVLTLTLPAAPATGRMVVVYDGVGQAAANNVTIDGNGKSIAMAGTSAGTKLLNTAYESATLVYNGTLWCAQNVV